jgi:serine/threonine protein kinase
MTVPQQSARLRPFRPVPFGRYTLLSPLATGGMGEIYLARLDGLQGVEKLCVIKKILPHLASDRDFVERFVNEAKILVKLSHGSIAQVLDVGLHDGDPYMALEHVDGKDLRKVAARARDKGEPLPLTFVLYVTGRVLDALAYAHRKKDEDDHDLNLVHRDVSPQNILISYEGEVKVIDFGLAKSTLNASKTHPSIILGKFLYMSPEQARHGTVDRRSDLYAVGLCLYELITGKNPFDDVPPGELMARVASPTILSVGEVDPLCPGPIQALVTRALQVEPAHRFQTAEEFRGKLLGCLLEIDPAAGPESVSKYMREAFSSEHQAERKLLNTLRDANRVAGRGMLPPPPRKEPLPEKDTAVVDLAKIALQGERAFANAPTNPALKAIPALETSPLSFAPTPRSKEDSGKSRPSEAETTPGVIVDEATRPAVPIPEIVRRAALTEIQPRVVLGDVPTETQPGVVVGTLVDPLLPPPPASRLGPPAVTPEESPAVITTPQEAPAVITGPISAPSTRTTLPPSAKRRLRWIWPVAVCLTLAAVAGVGYLTMRDWVVSLLGGRPATVEPATPQVRVRTAGGEEHLVKPALVSKAPVPEQGASQAGNADGDDLLSALPPAGDAHAKGPASKRPKRPAAALHLDAFHQRWAQTRAAYEQLIHKHPCEELGTLCLQYQELEREIDDAGDEAGSKPALQKKMERLTALIHERSSRGEQ